jgi:membrane protease YdiL (CAAX protease family)
MTPVRNQLAVLLGPPVRRDHRQSDEAFRHRRVVAVVTLVVGAVLLSLSLSREPGDPAFYVLTLALAATWVVGAVVSGPLHVGWVDGHGRRERPVLGPVLVALAAVAVFAVGGIAVAQVPPLHHLVDGVLDHARQGWLPLIVAVAVVNGIAEELFFRGALYAAIGARYPLAISTAVYTLTTVATGNLMLVFAAAVLGLVVGRQRQVTGGVLGPILTHVIWSTGMLLVLPPIMDAWA